MKNPINVKFLIWWGWVRASAPVYATSGAGMPSFHGWSIALLMRGSDRFPLNDSKPEPLQVFVNDGFYTSYVKVGPGTWT